MSQPSSNRPPLDEALLRNILTRVRDGQLSVDDAVPQLKHLTNPAIQSITALLQPVVRKQQSAAGWIVGIIFILIGGVFLRVGGITGYKTWKFLDAPTVEGRITAVAGGTPTAEYRVNNQAFVVHGTISSKPPAYQVGEKVKIFYNPTDPSDAQIDGFVERWLFPLIFGGIGGVLSLIGWLTLLWKFFFGFLFRKLASFAPRTDVESERFTIE